MESSSLFSACILIFPGCYFIYLFPFDLLLFGVAVEEGDYFQFSSNVTFFQATVEEDGKERRQRKRNMIKP